MNSQVQKDYIGHDLVDGYRYKMNSCTIQEYNVNCQEIEWIETSSSWAIALGLLLVVFILGFIAGRASD
jgi:hypothetical protein